jgi:predicted metal-dependent peptidase
MSLWVEKRIIPVIDSIDRALVRRVIKRLDIVPTHKIPTAGVLNDKLLLNPSWMSRLSLHEKQQVITHEFLHICMRKGA